MSILEQFIGDPTPTTLKSSIASTGNPEFTVDAHLAGGTYLLSGALTAATYKALVDVTGKGRLTLAGIGSVDATSRDLSLRITLDGTVAYEDQYPAIASTNRGFFAVGMFSPQTKQALAFDNIPFKSSLKIEVQSSLTETDKVFLMYRAHYS